MARSFESALTAGNLGPPLLAQRVNSQFAGSQHIVELRH